MILSRSQFKIKGGEKKFRVAGFLHGEIDQPTEKFLRCQRLSIVFVIMND